MNSTFAYRILSVPASAALLAGIAATAAVSLAPTTAATPGSFLEEIGINQATLPGKTPDQMVAAGNTVCGDLRHGVTVLDEATAVEKLYKFNQGTLFVSAATTHLCPDFAAGSAQPIPTPGPTQQPMSPVHVQEYVRGYCSPPSGQNCNARPSIHFESAGGQRVQFRYTADASGCSDAVFRFYLDGAEWGAPSTARPGQTVETPATSIRRPGGHDLSIGATGIAGGCNTGTLEAFGGTLSADSV